MESRSDGSAALQTLQGIDARWVDARNSQRSVDAQRLRAIFKLRQSSGLGMRTIEERENCNRFTTES